VLRPPAEDHDTSTSTSTNTGSECGGNLEPLSATAYPWPMSTDSAASREVELLSTLVGIASVNPLQAGEVSGPGGEAELANWLADFTSDLGAEVCLDEAAPGRPNLYAEFSGSSDATIVVDVHLDTVGVEHMTDDPFDGRQENGRVFGRGAVDTKATFAVILALLERIKAGELALVPNLLLMGTVGEEAGGLIGAHHFGEWARAQQRHFDQIVVAEPTLCVPVHGHKGGVGMEITVRGQAAHSSKPHLGRNAIVAAARIIEAFEREHDRIVAGPAPTEVGTGTLSVNEISGGRARNIIPDECTLYAGRRVAPGEDPNAVYQHLSALATEAAAPLEVEINLPYGRVSSAFYQDPTSPLVTTLATLADATPGTATYGSNALAYGDLAGEIVVFGPGSIDQAHMAVEWIEVTELARATEIYKQWLACPVGPL